MPKLNSSLCLALKTHRHAVAAIMYRPNEASLRSRIVSFSDAGVEHFQLCHMCSLSSSSFSPMFLLAALTLPRSALARDSL